MKKISLLLTYLLALSLVEAQTNGQISTPCTSSMISTFTPCMNYITGSSPNGRTTPSSDCCNALKSVMSGNMNCACLMITGGVPLPQIVNTTLGLGLPSFCRNSGVSLQCTASGVPLPPPGPLQFGAPPPPRSAINPKVSETPKAAPGPLHFGAAPSPSSDFSPQASKAKAIAPMDMELPPVEPPSSVEVEAPQPPRNPRVRPVLVIPSSSASSVHVHMLSMPITTTIWAFFIGFILLKLQH